MRYLEILPQAQAGKQRAEGWQHYADLSAAAGEHVWGLPPPPFQAVTAAVRSYQPNILNISLGTTFYLIERKIKMTCSWRVNISAEMGRHVLLKK